MLHIYNGFGEAVVMRSYYFAHSMCTANAVAGGIVGVITCEGGGGSEEEN
ncbi:MAG: hypothetical protein NT007_06785 [Candidatus Kapabacteria bacterium]|nr:hypothetical protein [Candidatus Kapabacteria bacterium]